MLISNLSHAGFNVNLLEEKDKSMAVEYANDNNIDLLIVIPEGFGEQRHSLNSKI